MIRNNKKLYIMLATSIFTSSILTACNQAVDNNSVVPVLSESVFEIEIPEPEPIEEPDNTIDDSELPGDIIEGSTLTKEEIEELIANAPDDIAKRGIEAYQSIIETGQWVVPGQGGQAIITEVVGKPGDDSWRQMTDEEARAYMEEKPLSAIGRGELEAGTWNKVFGGKLYFNPYEYQKALKEANDAVVGFTEADLVDDFAD